MVCLISLQHEIHCTKLFVVAANLVYTRSLKVIIICVAIEFVYDDCTTLINKLSMSLAPAFMSALRSMLFNA